MLGNAKRIVIKVGSSLLIDSENQLRTNFLAQVAESIAALCSEGKQVIVVTSGAVALGRPALGYGKRVLTLEEKQAAAACGQITLFSMWDKAFSAFQLKPAQILLAAEDSIHRRRYLNAKNTLDTLLENKSVIPVINENDTVATAELRFGDNDRLAARVAQMAEADLLIIFSDIDGLYTADPSKHKDATFIETVQDISDDIEKMAGGAASSVSSGGMVTKIQAARIATASGCHVFIARGTGEHPLRTLIQGGKHTHFVAKGTPRTARKEWIAGSLHATGSIVVDDGAAGALASGKSLLPAGVVKVEGQFDRGDAVLIKNKEGKQLGKGLIAYASDDATRIAGKKSQEIEQILGFKRRDVLIHRDDMVLE
ncbi:MAG: glutamate 5-kinase [Alphaproteobacteria bacterium]